jgi:hypothetical protein
MKNPPQNKNGPALADAKRRGKQKLSISLDERLLPELDARGEERSAVLSRDLARYYALLREARAQLRERLTPGELSAVIDVLNGHLFSPDILRGIEIWANVEDGCRLDGLDRKWEIDGAALVEKLKGLSLPEVHTLADATERFWHAVGAGEGHRDPARALD